MIKFGEPPYLECSSRGDRRFSAFYARLKCRNNQSIEDIYQGRKVFEGGETGLGWRDAKGRRPVNADEVESLYSELWDLYIDENPTLLGILRSASGLSDMFGQRGHQCQAKELWRIRGNYDE